MSSSLPTIGLIAGPDTGNEYEAIRQSLEYFGFSLLLKLIGRPNDFVKLLQGNDPVWNALPWWIYSVHGEEGRFIMPTLADDVYTPNEPCSGIGASDILAIGPTPNISILNTGCTLGHPQLVQAFLQKGVQTYIGTPAYVEGNAALLFVTRFFYELTKEQVPYTAFEKAQRQDEETGLFCWYGRQPIP